MRRLRGLRPASAFAVAVLLGSAPAAAQIPFTDVTVAAGVSYLQHDPPQAPPTCIYGGFFCQPGLMSGGAAVADVDGDGDLDLFVTRLDDSDLLFLNQGNGTFLDGSAAAGLDAFVLQSNGAAFGDIDNDGDPDLLVTVLGDAGDALNGRNRLFINQGAGTFSEEAVARGADVPTQPSQERYSWGPAFGDYDRDGYLDILLAEWQNGEHARLLRNVGATSPGFFTDETTAAGLSFVGTHGFAPAFVDLDGDGWQDIALAADFETSRLLWNDTDGTFTDGTVAAGVGTDENGMGSTFGDFDGDGDLDWFVTAIHDPSDPCGLTGCNWGSSGNRLYRNDGARVFSDATDFAGVRDGDFGWGAVFFDADNDRDLDLSMTNGVIFPGETLDDDFNADPMRLWQNDGTGVMTDVSAASGITDTGSGKALVTFDYDADGDLDLFVVNNAGQPRLYRNDQASGNAWVRVKVRGTTTNRDGVGARVSVWHDLTEPPQVREVGVSSHLLGNSELTLHFGLGAGVSQVARIEVSFPASGKVRVFYNLVANVTHTVNETLPRRCGLLGAELIPLALVVAARGRRRRPDAAGLGRISPPSAPCR